MDPWSSGVDSLKSRQEARGGDLGERFVDNFCDPSDQITFELLPDSDEYLKLLESKLQRLRTLSVSGVCWGIETTEDKDAALLY